MRSVSATTDAEIVKLITRPFYVVEIGFAIVLRLSSGPTVSWNSYSWTANGVRVEDIIDLPGGGREARITLPNTDNSAGALIMTDGIAGRSCKIWSLYGAGPYAAGDAVMEFSGVLDDADITLDKATMNAITEGRVREVSPRIYFESLCNHIPPAGRVIHWGGEHYELVTRDG